MAKTREPESEDQKQLRLASSLRNSTLRKVKQLLDKATNDGEACKQHVAEKFARENFPPSMSDHFAKQCDDFLAELAQARLKYGEEALKVEGGAGIDEVQKATKVLETLLSAVDATVKKFKDTTMISVKSLVS